MKATAESLPQISGSLAWLIHPIERREFFEKYFELQPLVIHRGVPNYFQTLLTLDEVDRVLTTLDRRYPDVALKNAAREIDPSEYTVDGETLDVARVYELFCAGSTISLAFLDTVVPQLALFCRTLETAFSCPFQTNVYLTPASAQGAKAHYDTHDVFVLQIAGSKQWTIYGRPVELPLPGQDYDPSVHPPGESSLEFRLEAGDLAYIPRGVVHDARSTDSVSLHVTAGILRFTWTDLLLEAVAGAALCDAAFRKALPPRFASPGYDRAEAREKLKELLARVAASPSLDGALDHFVEEFLSACPPFLRGQMAQLASLDRLTAESRVGVRSGVVWRLNDLPQEVSIEVYGRTMRLPEQTREAVRFALEHGDFAVRDLPGRLDEAGKLTLIRRLIREGLVIRLDCD